MDVAPAFIFFGVMVRAPPPAPRRLARVNSRFSPLFSPLQVYGVKGLRAKLLRDHRD